MTVQAITIMLGILFLATLIKSILGFGESLFSVPLLTMVLGIEIAVPLIAVIVAGLTALMVIRNWRSIDIRAIWHLTTAAIIGVPIGVWGLILLPSQPITLGLGILLTVVGLYYVFTPQITPLRSPYWTPIFGFVSGVLGGAYNMSGAPMIVYGASQQWRGTDFRGTLQSYFIIVSTAILVNMFISGLVTDDVLRLALYSVPVIAVAFIIGTYFAEKVPHAIFERVLHIMLIVLGLALVIRNLPGA